MFPAELFDEKKAAQAAAYFLHRSGGRKEMSVLKLMKLLYLAERRSFERYCEPIIGDRLVSMPHGPVLSITYNHMNGEMDSVAGGWEHWIGDRSGHMLALRNADMVNTPEQDLLELSDSDLAVLAEIWQEFGHMNEFELRDYTHENCPEWRDPNGSMIPMTFGDLFQALEFSKEKSQECLSRLETLSGINKTFRNARA